MKTISPIILLLILFVTGCSTKPTDKPSGWSFAQVNRMPNAETVCGVKVNAPFIANEPISVYGLDIGVGNKEEKMAGVQLGLLASIAQTGGGLQLSSCHNRAGGSASPFGQISLVNIDGAMQVGLFNRSGKLQIGAINSGEGNGLQIGAVNYLPNAWLPVTVGINFSF